MTGRTPPVRRLSGAVVLVLLLAAVPASGQAPLSLTADTSTTGYVGLRRAARWTARLRAGAARRRHFLRPVFPQGDG